MTASTTTPRQKRLEKGVDRILAKIDAIRQHANGLRRSPSVELDDEDSQRQGRKRLVGDAIGRDLMRNVAMFRGMMRRFEVDCIGAAGPELQHSAPDDHRDWAGEAVTWWQDWCTWCDGVDDTPFSELVSQALTASKREGDILWVFDDFDRDDGTLRIYESDQLVQVSPTEWQTRAAKAIAKGGTDEEFPWIEDNPAASRRNGEPKKVPMTQQNGVVRDRRGRVVAYVVHAKHGRASAPLAEVTIIPAWHPRTPTVGSAKLFKRQWRKSYRGSADATAISNMQQDVYEMISHELQSAKRAGQQAGWTQVDKDADTGGIERALLRAGIDPEKVLALAEADTDDGDDITIDNLSDLLASRNYDRLEALTGGYWEYADPGEQLHLFDNNRPSPNLEPFGDWLQGFSGYALGLGRSRALGKASTAYTAFRGEELMSWATFRWDQMSLQRRLLMFAMRKAIGWAASRGYIDPAPDRAWHRWFYWRWPEMPEVDQVKVATAQKIQQKLGKLDYRALLGPQWQEFLERFAEQVELLRALNLPLAILETSSGGVIDENDLENKDATQNTET